MPIRTTKIHRQPKPETYIVQASEITSSELYRYPHGTEEAVLRNVSFDVKKGESWAIIGEEAYELELLLQIVANVRPYGSGRCALVERGMMRQKRRVLPHVFYIAGGDTLPINLNTLEYLMYVTARNGIPDRKRQVFILETLLKSDLYYLTLVPIKFLSAAERAVVCLLSAALGNALLVVFSVPRLSFTKRLSQGIRYITDMVNKRDGAVLMATSDCDMAQAACSHAAFMVNGELVQSGPVEMLMNALDCRAFILISKEPESLAESIRTQTQGLEAYVFQNEVHVYVRTGEVLTQAAMMYILLTAGITVESITTSRRTLRNAYREVLAGHAV